MLAAATLSSSSWKECQGLYTVAPASIILYYNSLAKHLWRKAQWQVFSHSTKDTTAKSRWVLRPQPSTFCVLWRTLDLLVLVKTGSLLLAQYYHFNGKIYKTCRRQKAPAQQEEASSDSQIGTAKLRSLNSDIDGVGAFGWGSQVELTLRAHKGKIVIF